MSVIHIDKAGVIVIISSIVIINVHAAHSKNPTVAVCDINVTNLIDSTIMVIIDRCILNLNYRAIIIILGIGTIVIP